MSRRTKRVFSSNIVTIASFVAAAVTAQAQQKPQEGTKPNEKLEELVITGSRIARPDLDRLQPTMVVKADSFDERGYTDVGQALQELPAFGVQPSSAANQQQGFGIAQSFVDLYSLGSQRTLTLINGRRFVSSLPRARRPEFRRRAGKYHRRRGIHQDRRPDRSATPGCRQRPAIPQTRGQQPVQDRAHDRGRGR